MALSSSKQPSVLKPNEADHSWWKDPFLLKASMIVGSGGLIFGYDIGVISGTLTTLKDEFNLDGYGEGLVVSILYAGSIVGCIFGGPICDYLGRWKTIQLQNVVFVLGALVTGLATNITTLCIGRFLVGVASAVSGLADVPYLTEIAPQEFRGVLSGQYEILVALGILVSFCLDLAFASFHNGWRIAFLLPGVIALGQSLALLWLPESPKWLITHGKLSEGYDALCAVHGRSCVEHWTSADATHSHDHHAVSVDSHGGGEEVCPADVREYLRYKNRSASKDDSSAKATPSTTCCSPVQRLYSFLRGNDSERALMHEFFFAIGMSVSLQVLSQLTGSNVVRNFAPTIIEASGASTQLSLGLNVALGVVKLIFTTTGVLCIERPGLGRRGLLLWGVGLVAAGFGFLAIASAASPGGNLHSAGVFIGGCTLIYAGFGLGYGPVPWILSSEMVPTAIRGRIMSVSLIASNAAQLITNLLFVPMTKGITTAGSFALFFVLNVGTLLFAAAYMVETRDKPPPQILADLHRRYHQVTCKTLFRSDSDAGRRHLLPDDDKHDDHHHSPLATAVANPLNNGPV